MTLLTVKDNRLCFGGASALLSEVVDRAAAGLAEDHVRALCAGAKIPPPAWPSLLESDGYFT